MVQKFTTLLCALMLIGVSHAQSVWTDTPESSIPAVGERRIQPSKFRSVRMNISALQLVLKAAPERFSPAAESGVLPVLTIPLPDGGTGRFQLEETPVMHPDLQAKYPQIRTYTGRGLDDPTATLKCDLTPWGFHGMVRSGMANTVFIDPAVHGNTEFYVVYNKKDYLAKSNDVPWTCDVPSPDGAQELGKDKLLTPAQLAEFQGDTKLRRYRLALACTGEYATFHGGTKPLVLAAMNTSMNRVNGVYETDFAVTMQIIANNDAIIFLNAATDPYTNNDGGTMLGQNQTTCNNQIGVANYDIGHVFSTGGGGIAGLNVVCSTSKANGVTGSGAPVGDPFDIDYVAHEMGHQFGGNHTFNHCGSFNNSPAGVEPGSGTSIMAYAGICGADDVAAHSEDIFHGYNILEMGAFIYSGGGNTCPVKIASTNHNPDVNGGPNRTIPKLTPFALTATGSDVDGDTLTYTWEQIDPGNAVSPPTPTSAAGPLFRSYKGGTSPTRIFPRLQDLVNNINPPWEELPGIARNMNFRVVARDNDWFAGCTDEDDVLVTVSAASGPFLVTVPNTNVAWQVGSPQTITWDVANTTAAPVSCANVRITLSTDGGFTYPVELAASVPNNGSAMITVPNNVSNTCRVKVESVGNIFFDISNVNFRIELPPVPTFLLNTSVSSLNVCAGTNGSFAANLTSIIGFNSAVSMSVTGAPAGATVAVTPNPVTPSGVATVNITDLTPAMAGTYTLVVTASSGSITRTASVALLVLPGVPDLATAISPANGETGVGIGTTLSWTAGSFASSYLVEVATNPSFSAGAIVASQTVNGTSMLLGGLQIETVYYWRIKGSNDCGAGNYSASYAFQTGKNQCGQNFSSTDVPKTIDPNTINTVSSTINVMPAKTVNDVNVSMTITHTYTGDLVANLISPAGDTILLFDQPGVPVIDQFGCAGDNANLVFDSQAALDAAALEAQCNGVAPSLNGTFQSVESLNLLNGRNTAGAWKLLLSDNYPEDGGAITAWSLSFCFPQAIAPANILTNNPLNVVSGQSAAVAQSNLTLQTSGTLAQGVFILLSLPQHGTLALNGTPLGIGGSFTQADINNYLLVYTNNGDAASTDNFNFDAVDQNNDAWAHDVTFNINIMANNLAASAAETGSIDCNGAASGQITVAATGLNGVYTYSLNGGAGQSSNVFNGLAAGDYTVVVTGQFGFTVSTNPVSIAEPTAISIATSLVTNHLIVTASGGTGALEYSLDGMNFQASNEFPDLANGVYTLTVRDEKGCNASVEVIVAVNTLLVSLNAQNSITCAGASTGELVVTIGGGEAPFTYSLNGGTDQGSNVFSNLSAGTYTVVVTDNVGFSATSNILILTDPAELLIGASSVLNVVSVIASGGTGTLEYSLDGVNFQGNNQFGNVPNGTYTVTVRDENGCSKTSEVTVFVTPLSGSVQSGEILCFGGTTTIYVNAFDGIQPYEYKLGNSQFQSSNSFSGVAAGTYTASIRDASGTTLQLSSITITEPDQFVVSAFAILNDATVGFVGGTVPYSFLSDAPNPDLQNLPNGTYHVTATDANGCVATTTFTANVPPLTGLIQTTNINCNGGNNGTITIQGSGGIPPYLYSLNGGPFSTNNMFTDLTAGIYQLAIKDLEGNLITNSINLSEPTALNLMATVAGNNITANTNGGVFPYLYSLNGGPLQSSANFSGLLAGTYTVVVVDGNGCSASVGNLVVLPNSGTVEPAEHWGLSVSPNPSTGLFQLRLQNAPEVLRAQVYDATGRLIQSLELHPAGGAFNTTIDLQELPQGTYLLRLSDGQNWGGVRLSKMGN